MIHSSVGVLSESRLSDSRESEFPPTCQMPSRESEFPPTCQMPSRETEFPTTSLIRNGLI